MPASQPSASELSRTAAKHHLAKDLSASKRLSGKQLGHQEWPGVESETHQTRARCNASLPPSNMFETSVWIGGLPFVWGHERLQTEYCLHEELSTFGSVKRVEIRGHEATKPCYAYVAFDEAAAARAAIRQKFIPFYSKNFGDIYLTAKAWGGREMTQNKQNEGRNCYP